MSQENQNIQEEPHKRRVRYKGKYPRNYKEKYKELNPEKYQGYDQESDPERQYTGGNAYIHYGEGDHRFSADQTWADRI